MRSPCDVALFRVVVKMMVVETVNFFMLSDMFVFISLFFGDGVIPVTVGAFVNLKNVTVGCVLSKGCFTLSNNAVERTRGCSVLEGCAPFPLVDRDIGCFGRCRPVGLVKIPVRLLDCSLVIGLIFTVVIVTLNCCFCGAGFERD